MNLSVGLSMMLHSFTQSKVLPQCPGHRSQWQWLVGRLWAHWPPQTAPRHQTPAVGPMLGKESRSGPAAHTHQLSMHIIQTHTHTHIIYTCVHMYGPTSVTWLCVEKKTRAKGSERPLLSAANRLRAWYMCALSWNTCFTVGHTQTHTHHINWQSISFVSNLIVKLEKWATK